MVHFDLVSTIRSIGYAGVWGIVFAESGIPFCFFLPGDSLLFTAGFIASTGHLNIVLLAGGCVLAAIAGNLLNYEIGRRVGLRLFAKGDTRFIKQKHLDMTRSFYDKHGVMAVVLARFMPIVRTFTPFLAGMVKMPYSRFMILTVVGAVVWGAGLTAAGFFFGQLLPPEQIDRYLLPVILLIIIASVLPSAWHIWKELKAGKNP